MWCGSRTSWRPKTKMTLEYKMYFPAHLTIRNAPPPCSIGKKRTCHQRACCAPQSMISAPERGKNGGGKTCAIGPPFQGRSNFHCRFLSRHLAPQTAALAGGSAQYPARLRVARSSRAVPLSHNRPRTCTAKTAAPNRNITAETEGSSPHAARGSMKNSKI